MTSSTAGTSLAHERALSLLDDESRVSSQQRAVVTAYRDFSAAHLAEYVVRSADEAVEL
jgi:hypothetical protein